MIPQVTEPVLTDGIGSLLAVGDCVLYKASSNLRFGKIEKVSFVAAPNSFSTSTAWYLRAQVVSLPNWAVNSADTQVKGTRRTLTVWDNFWTEGIHPDDFQLPEYAPWVDAYRLESPLLERVQELLG